MQCMEHKLQEGSNFQLYYLLLNSKRLEQCLALKGEWVNPEGNGRYCVGPIVTWGELWLGRLNILPKIIWGEHGGPRMWTAGVGFESPHSESLHWTGLLYTSCGSLTSQEIQGRRWCLVWWLSLWSTSGFFMITSENRRGCWSLWNIILERHNKIFLLFFNEQLLKCSSILLLLLHLIRAWKFVFFVFIHYCLDTPFCFIC